MQLLVQINSTIHIGIFVTGQKTKLEVGKIIAYSHNDQTSHLDLNPDRMTQDLMSLPVCAERQIHKISDPDLKVVEKKKTW